MINCALIFFVSSLLKSTATDNYDNYDIFEILKTLLNTTIGEEEILKMLIDERKILKNYIRKILKDASIDGCEILKSISIDKHEALSLLKNKTDEMRKNATIEKASLYRTYEGRHKLKLQLNCRTPR